MKEILSYQPERGYSASVISPMAVPQLIEIAAMAGISCYIIDGEHGMLQADVCETAVLTARSVQLPLCVRLPENSFESIGQWLDMGFSGVLLPHIQTFEQAEAASQAALFPPVGTRGIGQCRANGYTILKSTQKFAEENNVGTPLIFMLEDAGCLGSLDKILSVKGVGGVCIGTRDLSTSLGCPGDFNNPMVKDAIYRIVRACRRNGLPVLLPVANDEMMEYWRGHGVNAFLMSLYPALHRAMRNFTQSINKKILPTGNDEITGKEPGKMMYPKLFEKAKIGNLTLKNRIVMTSMGIGLAGEAGEVTDDLISYYEERAKGGTGMIISGIFSIDEVHGHTGAQHPYITSNIHLKPLEKMAGAIRKYGTKMLIQLYHPGKEVRSAVIGGRQPLCPTTMLSRFGEMTQGMTYEQIQEIIKRFVFAAETVKKAGFDGVEVHCAHGYLLNQFLSPAFNHRSDEYGGCLDNRLRLPMEIISEIRRVCGPDFVISARISADDFYAGGNTLEDGKIIASMLESAGLNVINVNCSVQESSQYNREPPSFAQGWKKHLATEIRKVVSIPVIAVNNIKQPSFAEMLLEEGVCDFVGLSRPHLADPYWTLKAREGRDDEIRSCISCLRCIQSFAAGKLVRCTVNPMALREREFANPNCSGKERTVAVVGGGPGGLEAAHLLARRGYAVTLFEKENELGGQLRAARVPKGKEKLAWTMGNMISRAKNAGVKFRLGCEATVDEIQALDPVAVFICTGGKPILPSSIPGITNSNVYTAYDVLLNKVSIEGKRVVIIGSGFTGIETAKYLGERGYEVNMVEMKKSIGEGLFPPIVADMLKEIQPYNPKLYTAYKLSAVTDGEVVATSCEDNKQICIPADAVVLAMGVKPVVPQELIEAFPDAVVLGDAYKSGNMLDAVRDGFEKAWILETKTNVLV